MTLQEYEAQGGCEGCYFYGTIDVDGRKGCTFHWFDDESEDWEYSKNCAESQSDEYCENIAACVYCQNYTWIVNRF